MNRLAGLLFAAVVAVGLTTFGSAGNAKDIEVPPIPNAAQAKTICPQICKSAGGKWDGNWQEAKSRGASVCSCDMPRPDKGPRKLNIKTGAIASDQQAGEICPMVCKGDNRTWQDEWKKTDSGRAAVCTCYRK